MSRWRPGATPRAKGCLLFVAVIVTHFTFSRKGLDFSGKRVNKRVCVCYYAKHKDVLEKSWCACVWSTVNAVLFFFAYYSGVVTAFVMAGMRFILCLFTCLLVLAASQCFMWACVCLLVFIGSQWVEQSSWPHFLLLLTDRHLVPRLQRLDSAWRSVVSLLATTAWFVIGSFGSLFFFNPSYCDSVLVDNEVRTCL